MRNIAIFINSFLVGYIAFSLAGHIALRNTNAIIPLMVLLGLTLIVLYTLLRPLQ